MVPVVDKQKVPLMPCSEKRARQLMEKGQAKDYWQKGIFCIMLLKEPSQREYQEVVLGLDTGSKREGYTVATKESIVLNIITNTPDWVKENVETRRNLRRNRRGRKTPYRKMRYNRATLSKTGRIPPSTKARWNAKLRIIDILLKFLPLTQLNVEDIKAQTKQGDKKWNKAFSPLEMGKNYFYQQILNRKLKLIKTQGYDTYAHRNNRGFTKLTGKGKLEYKWEAHNCDSHSLCEMLLGVNLQPYKGLWKIEFHQFHRRQLHVQVPVRGGARKHYGSTVSLGMPRGSVLRYYPKIKLKHYGKLVYLGGFSKGKLTVHNITNKSVINKRTKKEVVSILYRSSIRTNFCRKLVIIKTNV